MQPIYRYAELNKLPLTRSSQPVNFYGVVIDASYPQKQDDKYVCSLKIIDKTLNCQSEGKYVEIMIYGYSMQDVPIVRRIGDIIRIHGAYVRVCQGQCIANVNVFHQSFWLMYSSDRLCPQGRIFGNQPYSFSGRKPIDERNEVQILKKLKEWIAYFISQFNVVQELGTTPLSSAGIKNFFWIKINIVAKVLKVTIHDQKKSELRLKDQSGQVYNTEVDPQKFPHIRKGMVVRISSCSLDWTTWKKYYLVLQPHSNIMSFISSSQLARVISYEVTDDEENEQAEIDDQASENL